MLRIRRSDERGRGDYGWLDARYTFSFAGYHDPSNVHFRALRVMNEDRVAPGGGFPKHPHDNMEIVTYVLEGALAHQDSLGNGSQIRAGELQLMTAGSGIEHSEANASADEPVHLYQIWLFPEAKNLEPGYEQRAFPESDRQGRLQLVASRTGEQDSLTIHQDARLYLGTFDPGESTVHEIDDGRHLWVQVLRGSVTVEGATLDEGDGAALSDEASAEIVGGSTGGEVMVFDLS